MLIKLKELFESLKNIYKKRKVSYSFFSLLIGTTILFFNSNFFTEETKKGEKTFKGPITDRVSENI
jgi:hypothetical protein